MLSAALAVPAGLAGCGPAAGNHHTWGHVFGTTVSITIHGASTQRAQELGAAVLAEFDRLHHKFHAWQPGMLTELNQRIARGLPLRTDAEMAGLLQSAARLAERSDHLFNPAIGHLLRLWGFQGGGPRAAPDRAELRHWVAANPRMSDLRFHDTAISSVNPAVRLDLGGYAKGYALDRAAAILRAARVEAALVNIGGNVLAIGQPGGRPWQVGIRNPRAPAAAGNTLCTIPLFDNEAIGTSGDYERFVLEGGLRRPHIIDPRTGMPALGTASVTVLASGGADAGLRSDGNSKPLFIAGALKWENMAGRLDLPQALLVEGEGGMAMTSAMRRRVSGLA
ncbi:FAD:protein FMN transferase [Massilia sp. FT127W]|uniref:FAD:protein FMN transferase n=2 Tax=Pseudoduganella aquatica TaxID=2660641 RepID=A0A7X4KNC5_9BURK|nr:FAD:protein FMN transferase [Pseudoduganella aquatica]